MVGDALVRTINALVGECMSVEALASVAATPEAPACTLAALRCILTIVGDAAYAAGARDLSDDALWRGDATGPGKGLVNRKAKAKGMDPKP